ncbi:MAG: FtsX-like permease family protein [Spirochaetales bacterium]
MNLIALAFRNLVRQKRRTSLLAAAVALGFAAVALLVGLTGGMAAGLKENMSRVHGGHVFIKAEVWNANGKIVSALTPSAELEAAVATQGDLVKSFHRRSTVETTLIFGSKSSQTRLIGLEWEREADVRDGLTATAGTLPSSLGLGQVVLNSSTATRLGVQPGDSLLLKFTTLDGQQSVLDVTVAAVAQSAANGLFGSDSYLSLAQAGQMLGLEEGQFQALNLTLNDLNQQTQVAASLEQTLAAVATVKLRRDTVSEGGEVRWSGPRYSVSILDDFLSMFTSLFSTIQSLSLVIFFVLMAVIVLGISNTFRMILRERTVEIGTLRAIGLRKKGILIVFLAEAAAVLALGLVGGALLAVLVGALLSLGTFDLGNALGIFLSQGKLRFVPDLSQVLVAAVLIFAAGLVAAWRPARTAANLLPADALRSRS